MPTMTTARPEEYRARLRNATNRRSLDELRRDVRDAIADAADSGTDESGSFSPEAQQLFDALKSLLSEIDGKISRQAVLDDLDVRSRRDRSERRFDRSLYSYSIQGMVLRAIGIELPGVDLGPSIEIAAEIRNRPGRAFKGVPCPIEALALRADYAQRLELRNVSTTTPAAGPGSNLIATTLDATRYIDALRARTVVRQAGAQVISGLVGNLDLPRMTKTAQVAWFAEGSNITRTDEAFDRVHFSPKHCGAIVPYSINMLLQSTPDIEMIIRDDLSRLLALELDRVALVGSGVGAEPRGVINVPGVVKVPGTAFSYANNVAMRGTLTGKNVPLEALAWIGNSVIDSYGLMAVDAMAHPLGRELVYLGFPGYVSNVATSTTSVNPLILGAWSDLQIAFWRELDLRASDQVQSAWDQGGVEVRAIMDADVNVRHPESFVWADMLTGPVQPAPSDAPAPTAAAHKSK